MPKWNHERSDQDRRSGQQERRGQGGRESSRRSQARRETDSRLPEVERRGIKRDKMHTQLLERGEGPTAEAQLDPAVDSPGEQSTTEGGPATDSAYRYGGPVAGPHSGLNPESRETGGEGDAGGYSTLGGGVYPDEGSPDDAPRYGDWTRHSSGTTSGARGEEGFAISDDRAWGEAEYRAAANDKPKGRRRSDAELTREIYEILTEDPELAARDIEVVVEDGAVTLTGIVENDDAKLLAEELVESVTGVHEIHNRLEVTS